jgi:HlyD family secretion protein
MEKIITQIRRWKFPIIALIGLLFALISVLSRPPSIQKRPLKVPPNSQYEKTVAGIGVVEPRSEVINLGVELPGVVRVVHVKVGDNVKAGDVLFTLDQRDIDAQIAILESSLAAARVRAEDASAQFAIVDNIKDKRAIAKDDFNRRKYAKQFALAQTDEIKAQLAQARMTKERLIIRAPINSRILEINIRPGEYAGAGTLSNPLMRIGDVSTLHVRVEVDEGNASRIQTNNEAIAMLRGDTQKIYTLKFVRFEPYVRPKQNLAITGQQVDTRVIHVIYELLGNNPSIFVGQQMDVFIKDNSMEHS